MIEPSAGMSTLIVVGSDVHPRADGQPGSDPALLREHLLDRLSIAAAVLVDVQVGLRAMDVGVA